MVEEIIKNEKQGDTLLFSCDAEKCKSRAVPFAP